MSKTGPWNANKMCCGTCTHSKETETEGCLDCSVNSRLCPEMVHDFDYCLSWEPEDGDWTRYL